MNIGKLINIEFQKFSKNSVIRFLLGLYIIFLPIALFMGKELDDLPSFLLSNEVFFTFQEEGPAIWDYLGYIGNWMSYFFLGVVAIYLFGIEVTNKTLRQSVINGLTRSEYFLSKIISIVMISLIASLYFGLCAIVIGMIHTEGASLSFALDNDWAMSRYFLMCLGYLTFALLIAVLIRKPALSVFLYLSYVLIIELVLRYSLNYIKVPYKVTKFFPMNVVEDLHPMPFFKIPAAKMGPDGIQNLLLTYQTTTLVTLAYVALFLFLSYRLFMSRDI